MKLGDMLKVQRGVFATSFSSCAFRYLSCSGSSCRLHFRFIECQKWGMLCFFFSCHSEKVSVFLIFSLSRFHVSFLLVLFFPFGLFLAVYINFRYNVITESGICQRTHHLSSRVFSALINQFHEAFFFAPSWECGFTYFTLKFKNEFLLVNYSISSGFYGACVMKKSSEIRCFHLH